MPNVAGLRRLSSTLISLYPGLVDARSLAERAGLRVANIDTSGPPRAYMWNIVNEANKTRRLRDLLASALEDYPNESNLTQANDDNFALMTSPVESPPVPPDQWRPALGMKQAEKLMGSTSTFLPISFLELGLERARSVGRVALPDLGTGTGFLVEADRLVTNHHVIPDRETAEEATVQFNYQESLSGEVEATVSYRLAPSAFFQTSPATGGADLTIVKVDGLANRDWGALALSTDPIAPGARVMIVQHPEGGFKKVALNNNLVTYADADIVQYYTDTLPGSSGSPVFDTRWRVVGIHHAGGDVVDPGSGRVVFRNEGIAAAQLSRMLGD